MNITQCEKGHFYDADSYSVCPHCNGQVKPEVNTVGLQEQHNVHTMPVNNTPPPDDKTIGFYPDTINMDPVVGWLVCIEGPSLHKGTSFPLKAGGNFIGRESDMDVAITGDKTVARKKHAVIIYEPIKRVFKIQQGEAKELCYVNDEVILTPTDLTADDKIKVGNTELVFIPFCRPGNDFWKHDSKKA